MERPPEQEQKKPAWKPAQGHVSKPAYAAIDLPDLCRLSLAPSSDVSLRHLSVASSCPSDESSGHARAADMR